MAAVIVFYSWQSDTCAAANRSLIHEALEGAAAELRDDVELKVEPVIERDTQGVPGAPDIGASILEKIDACAVFVADVTNVTKGEGRPSPNPNVLLELGYSLKALSDRRIVLVLNTAFGGPEQLPFDLRQKRAVTYHSADESPNRAENRRGLQRTLREALRGILLAEGARVRPSAYPVELSVDYKVRKQTQERHDYTLEVALANVGVRPIKEWHVDVDFPTPLLEPAEKFFLAVADRSNAERTLFRSTHETHKGPIFPGDRRVVASIDYRIDFRLFHNDRGVLGSDVTATAYAHDEQAATVTKAVHDLNRF